jgi:hypothetical protein
MEDVVTGADSQRVIHGTLGSTALLAAPYGSGRFLSLFRTKLETLTIKYRDSDGGLHGAIFMMPVGRVEEIKKELLAQGAHTSIPPEQAASASSPTARKSNEDHTSRVSTGARTPDGRFTGTALRPRTKPAKMKRRPSRWR